MTHVDGDYVRIDDFKSDNQIAQIIYHQGQWFFKVVDPDAAFCESHIRQILQQMQILSASGTKN